MKISKENVPTSNAFLANRLNIWLSRSVRGDELGEWMLERVSVKTPECRSNMHLRETCRASAALRGYVWNALRDYLPGSAAAQLMSLPDLTMTTEQSFFGALQITGQPAASGVQHVTCEFRQFIGALDDVLSLKSLPDPMREASLDVCCKTMDDVMLPAVNMSKTHTAGSDQDGEEAVQALLDTLQARLSDIEHYVALISRFAGHDYQATHTRPVRTLPG